MQEHVAEKPEPLLQGNPSERSGTDASRILMVTFTNRATREMRSPLRPRVS